MDILKTAIEAFTEDDARNIVNFFVYHGIKDKYNTGFPNKENGNKFHFFASYGKALRVFDESYIKRVDYNLIKLPRFKVGEIVVRIAGRSNGSSVNGITDGDLVQVTEETLLDIGQNMFNYARGHSASKYKFILANQEQIDIFNFINDMQNVDNVDIYSKLGGRSRYNYNLGDEVEMTSNGSTYNSKFRNEVNAKRGERGIITGLNDKRTEVLLESGKYVTRYELSAYSNFELIKRNNNQKSITKDELLREKTEITGSTRSGSIAIRSSTKQIAATIRYTGNKVCGRQGKSRIEQVKISPNIIIS